jgi:ABC-type multidrug transport system fused ATPase/permease subunit
VAEAEKGDLTNNDILCRYVKQVKGSIIIGIIWLFGGLFSDFATPVFIGWCVDDMINCNYSEVDLKVGILFAIIVFTAVASGFRARIFNTLSDEISMIIRLDLFQHLIFQDTAFYDKKENSTGQVIARMSSDVEII